MPFVDGIVSQIDTTSLIEASLAVMRVPMQTQQARVAQAEKSKEAIASMNTKLVALSDAIKAMDTLQDFQAFTVGSSATQYRLTASAGASVGTYAIRVDHLATSETSTSQGFADRSANVLGTGTLSVTVGGVKTDLAIDAAHSSLEDVAAAIDEVDGLSAYVLDTGDPTGRYKLVVQGTDTGAANGFSFDTSGLAWGTIPTFTETTTAVDAEIEVGGVTIHSSSNVVDGAIPGIKIELLAPGGAAETSTVSEDTEAMKAKIQTVLTAWNDVLAFQRAETSFDAASGLRGGLVGDSSTRNLVDDLSSLITNPFEVDGSLLSSLAELGIETQRDGTLAFDTEAFDEAWAADADSVRKFLTSATGPLTAVSTRIDTLYVDPDDGILASRTESLETQIEDLEDSIADTQVRLDDRAKMLRDQFTAMEVILGQVQGTQSYLTSFFAPKTTS